VVGFCASLSLSCGGECPRRGSDDVKAECRFDWEAIIMPPLEFEQIADFPSKCSNHAPLKFGTLLG
jgi:hypothetical protein